MNSAKLIIGQYGASLEMLRAAVTMCPRELWAEIPPKYPFWRIGYHALFFTQIYASTDLDSMVQWKRHDEHMEDLDARSVPTPYSPSEVIEYTDFTERQIREAVPNQKMDGPSGIPWWQDFTKLEMHIYNIRHTQHHVGQLVDRLRNDVDLDVPWIGAK